MSPKTLGSIGEFKIIADIIRPALFPVAAEGSSTDDCGSVEIPASGRVLIVSTDVAPKPLAWNHDPDPYRTWGWYSVAIGLSDLAAAGARPFIFANSVDAPAELTTEDLGAFFLGIADACRSACMTSVGGNLRSASSFSCHSTIVGITECSSGLRRSGCRPGDFIVSIGACGRYISAFLKVKRLGLNALTEQERVALFRPTPPIEPMRVLHSAGLVRAGSDNSDGLLGAVWNILEASGCGVRLDLRSSELDASLSAAGIGERYRSLESVFFLGGLAVCRCGGRTRC